MRLARSSLRVSTSSAIVVASVLMLGFGIACGGGGAAPPPTGGPTVALPASPAPSPQRPALTSPVPSPSPAAAASTPASTAVEAATVTYEVESGDTLLSIAEQQYGDATQWRRIYDANKDVVGNDPDKLKIGMKLKIPPKQS